LFESSHSDSFLRDALSKDFQPEGQLFVIVDWYFKTTGGTRAAICKYIIHESFRVELAAARARKIESEGQKNIIGHFDFPPCVRVKSWLSRPI